jgi:DNA-binding LacI/PurR family transcriptional regulator
MDTYDYVREPTPPAATIDKQNALQGRRLVELLLARIAGKVDSAPQHWLVAPKLITPLEATALAAASVDAATKEA